MDTDEELKNCKADIEDSSAGTMSQRIADMRQSSSKSDKLLITVVDTGNGIKTKYQQSVFANMGILGSSK